MTRLPKSETQIARTLILDELFDLTLYQSLEKTVSPGPLQDTLRELIPIETKHRRFWEDFYGLKIERLDFGRRLKLGLMVLVSRLFGERGVYLILEAIEIHGIRKYLSLWKRYEHTPLADAVRTVLTDEFDHEDRVVSGYTTRRINPERIRNIFLGFNDGLVEFVGAVSGFFAAFQSTAPVLMASLTGAAAGALSMAVGVYVSSGSEKEVQKINAEKEHFLSGTRKTPDGDKPLSLALIVGVSYFIGAMVPVLPVIFGAKNVFVSWAAGGGALILVTMTLSFISGMSIRARVLTNVFLVSAAVAISYAFGAVVKKFLGIEVL